MCAYDIISTFHIIFYNTLSLLLVIASVTDSNDFFLISLNEKKNSRNFSFSLTEWL